MFMGWITFHSKDIIVALCNTQAFLMRYSLRCCVFIFTFFVVNFSSSKVYASHAAGAELVYQWLHDSTYQLFYKFYRDCSGIQEASTVTLCYNNSCTSYSNSVSMTKVTVLIPPGVANGSEILELCPGYQSTCTQLGSTIPGYREWWYTVTVTLPSQCNNWTFGVYQGSRNSATTNLADPGSQDIYTEATLDNLDAQGDTSPIFSVKPIPFVCDNIPGNFNCSAYDINNDSMIYTLIQPMTNTSTCTGGSPIPWAAASPAFNLTDNPFQTNNTFSLSGSGMMTFTPNQTQIAALAIRVDEYRNSVKIGSVMRDIQVIVMSCSIPVQTPIINGPSNLLGAIASGPFSDTIIGSTGISIYFDITAYNMAPNAIVYLYPDVSSANNASFNLPNNGTNSDTGTFIWIPTISDIGDHLITFLAIDSACSSYPLILSTSVTKTIRILPSFDTTCFSRAVGNTLDSSDIGIFYIAGHAYDMGGSQLNNPAAILSRAPQTDTLALYTDSSYIVSVSETINTPNDADAKVTLFIDYNNNLQYDIPNERAWLTYIHTGQDTPRVILRVPSYYVTPNIPVHMRLILNNDLSPSAASDSACGPYVSGETEDFIVIFRNAVTSVKSVNNTANISFWPNPSTGKFTIKMSSGRDVSQLNLTVMSITGQKIYTQTYQDVNRQFSVTIDLSTMPKGLYFVETDTDGEKRVSKIAIQ